jgi:hypothetical protein
MGLLNQQAPGGMQGGLPAQAPAGAPAQPPTPVNRNISPQNAPQVTGQAPPDPGAAGAPLKEGMVNMDSLNKYIENAMKIVHDPKVSDEIIGDIQAAEDPVDAVGESAVEIADRMWVSAQEGGFEIDVDIMSHGLNVIVGEVIDVAEAAGTEKFTEDERFQAYSWALSQGIDRAVKTGKISEEELTQMGGQAAKNAQVLGQGQDIPGLEGQAPPQPEGGV